MKRHNFYVFILILLTMISCQSAEDEEYEVLNVVVKHYITPNNDKAFLEYIKIDSTKYVDPEEVALELSKKMNTFTISDTLYSPNLTESNWDDLHSKDYFVETERNIPSKAIDFKRITFNKNTKRASKPSSGITYIGHFKLYRVVFDKWRKRALVQVDTDAYMGSGFRFLLKKEKGEWVIENQ